MVGRNDSGTTQFGRPWHCEDLTQHKGGNDLWKVYSIAGTDVGKAFDREVVNIEPRRTTSRIAR